MDVVSLLGSFVSGLTGGTTAAGLGTATGVSGGIATGAGALTSGALAAKAASPGGGPLPLIEKTEIQTGSTKLEGKRKKGIQSTILAGETSSSSSLVSTGGNTLLGGG